MTNTTEQVNPHLEGAATPADIRPGVELEVVALRDGDSMCQIVRILGELMVGEDGQMVVEAETTACSGGDSYTFTGVRNLCDLGITPSFRNQQAFHNKQAPHGQQTWNAYYASRVVPVRQD